MKAVVFNLGCKVNQYESDKIAEELAKIGYEVSEQLVPADIYVLNTCAVTAEAERKSRQAVARCRALNSEAKVFVCGCASQKSSALFEKDNVFYVAGATNKQSIVSHLNDKSFSSDVKDLPTKYDDEGILSLANRTRAYVKIQDGCNSFCTYCIIPYLRGRSRSREIDDIVDEVSVLSTKTSEIVLTGINIMSYGLDIGTNLTELIKALKDFDVRIRLGSFYAEGITEELLDALFSLKKFCPHFHLSLQSGDKQVLKDMNRHYTPEIYEEKINLIRRYDKNACIATDIIVGFPTESEECHKNTVEFIRKVGFSDIHVFPFSSREGTRAAKFKQLSPEVIKRRRDEMLTLKEELRNKYLEENVGIKQNVLIEEKSGDYYCGYSQYYIRIYTRHGAASEIKECTPSVIYKDGLLEA